jgi:FtsP/CotA-like multicopper oxidase with cupredoxin domain
MLAVTAAALVPAEGRARTAPPTIAPNDNRVAAGTSRDGVLTLSLDAVRATWHPDGDSLPGIVVEAFAESGRPASAPGPLVRVPVGTELRLTVRNTLPDDTLTFSLPARLAGADRGAAMDSLVLAPGASGELRVRATRPGSYVYRANGRTPIDRVLRMRGLLGGAIVVDSAGARPRDRVLVLLGINDSLTSYGVPVTERAVVGVNGRAWPHTERVDATVGDTVVWRILNASADVHPMHLHGFYFRVDDFDGPPTGEAPGRLVVTERMLPFTTMTVTWVPERAGNWLFHCHYQPHARPHRPLDAATVSGATRPVAAAHGTAHDGAASHAMAGHAMGGLVMGVHVRPRPGARVAARVPDAARRRLRLVALRDAGFPDSLPSLRFRLEEPRTGWRAPARPGISPVLDLVRGEPVAITVVNTMREPVAVHWHGIELESYHDGVPGFSGAGTRTAPLVAPGDSFTARFTPPRAGTFMYHSHVDEVRHHRAGLEGAIVVREGAAPRDTAVDKVFLLKSARGSTVAWPMEIDGAVDPDTLVLRAGRRYRFRFVGLTVTSPNATITLTARRDSSLANPRDTLLARWRPVAKDGRDLPMGERTVRPASLVLSIGETHDVEFTPVAAGDLRLEVRPPSLGRLTVRVPVRVEAAP